MRHDHALTHHALALDDVESRAERVEIGHPGGTSRAGGRRGGGSRRDGDAAGVVAARGGGSRGGDVRAAVEVRAKTRGYRGGGRAEARLGRRGGFHEAPPGASARGCGAGRRAVLLPVLVDGLHRDGLGQYARARCSAPPRVSCRAPCGLHPRAPSNGAPPGGPVPRSPETPATK